MICPRCEADTMVIDTRQADLNTIRRRRECHSCSHRFTTYESTVKPDRVIKHRLAASARKARWLKNNPDKHEAIKAAGRIYQNVRKEAQATGKTQQQVRSEWGLT